MTPNPTTTVVRLLGAALLLSLAAITGLVALDRDVPDVLAQVPGMALAALAALLSPRPDLSVVRRAELDRDLEGPR